MLTAERSLFFLVNTQYGEAIEEWAANKEGVGGTEARLELIAWPLVLRGGGKQMLPFCFASTRHLSPPPA